MKEERPGATADYRQAEPPRRGTRRLRAFRRMLDGLKYLVFSDHPKGEGAGGLFDFSLSDDEILFQLGETTRGSELFMGRYPPRWVWASLERHGVVERLRRRGYSDGALIMRTMSFDILEHRICIYDGEEAPERLLIDARLREGIFRPKEHFVPEHQLASVDSLVVDYLVCQDPRRAFEPGEPPLPGQAYPGLGVLKPLMFAIVELAKGLCKEAIVNVPEHYHAAIFYSPPTIFYSPVMEGKAEAMRRDIGTDDLARLSHAVGQGCLYNEATREYEPWRPGELIEPLIPEVRAYFDHPDYARQVREAELANRYRIDWSRYRPPETE